MQGNWGRVERQTAALLGQDWPKSNAWRQGVGAYLGRTGTDSGYGFFAPHVPAAYKLVFEIHYADGRVEYEGARIRTRAGQLRMTTLLDLIGRIDDAKVCEGVIKFLVHGIWRDHPNISLVRAIFGTVNVPTAAAFAQNETESYRVLYAYDVTAEPTPAPTTAR
jgi:hypothetical protein